MAKERSGNGRPKSGRKNAEAKRSGGTATAFPAPAEAPGPALPPEKDAAEARPGRPEESIPVDPPPEAPVPSLPAEPLEDFKLLSSFVPEPSRETAAEPPAAEPAPITARAGLAPRAEAAPAPTETAFPPEDAWNGSGGEVEESGSDLLCFRIANEEYAIDIQRVWEIIRSRPVTEIPGVPEFISGIIALRGEIVPVLDLRRRLGFTPIQAPQASAKIIVAIHDGRRIGMAVDAVSHKIHVLEGQITQPSALLGGQESGFLTGVCRHQGRLIAILNAEHVLSFRIGGESAPVEIPHGGQGDRGAQGGVR